MDQDKLAFRTTAVGGFHKQDVILYIQTLSKHYTDQLNRLTAELEAEKAARLTAEEQCRTAPQGAGPDDGETERLRGALDARTAEAGRLKAELSAAAAACAKKDEAAAALSAEFEREKAALRARLDEAERRAAALTADAARAEAEVQERAQKAAEAAAAAFQTECDSHLAQIQERYARLRGGIETTVLRVTGELERVHAALTGAMAAFHEQDGQE